MTKKPAPQNRSAAAQELEAAFTAEGITVRDLIKTLNEVRTSAERYSTKTGEPVGADHQARGKAACDLLELLGLPEKRPASPAPAAPRSVAEALRPAVCVVCGEPGAHFHDLREPKEVSDPRPCEALQSGDLSPLYPSLNQSLQGDPLA